MSKPYKSGNKYENKDKINHQKVDRYLVPNDFTRVLTANAADASLPIGSAVGERVLQ